MDFERWVSAIKQYLTEDTTAKHMAKEHNISESSYLHCLRDTQLQLATFYHAGIRNPSLGYSRGLRGDPEGPGHAVSSVSSVRLFSLSPRILGSRRLHTVKIKSNPQNAA